MAGGLGVDRAELGDRDDDLALAHINLQLRLRHATNATTKGAPAEADTPPAGAASQDRRLSARLPAMPMYDDMPEEKLEQLRRMLEDLDTIEVIDDDTRALIAKRWPWLLAKLPPQS